MVHWLLQHIVDTLENAPTILELHEKRNTVVKVMKTFVFSTKSKGHLSIYIFIRVFKTGLIQKIE